MSKYITMLLTLSVVFGLLIPDEQGIAQTIADLTVPEQVGVDRDDEPVRMGIPLPKGMVNNVNELALVSANGRPVPCQFKEVMRWLDDKSLKWVHVVFQASVKAGDELKLKLVKGKAANAGNKVTISKQTGEINVQNGVLGLIIKDGSNFNLFDQAYASATGQLDANSQIIKSHNGGFIATINGKEYRPGNDTKVSVYEEGPECAVIRASGRLANGDDSPFSFICYIHIFQGSPAVKVNFSYVHAAGTRPADHVRLDDLSLVLPTTLGGGTVRIGGEDKVFTGRSGMILAKNSDLSQIKVNGKNAGTAKGKSSKPYTTGWGGFKAQNKGLYGGLRWFWQMFPRAVELREDGTLRIAMFAKEADSPLDTYMGQGRTHYITLLFDSDASDSRLQDFYAGTQMPLRVVCTPKYYCRDTKAFGPIVILRVRPLLYTLRQLSFSGSDLYFIL